MQLPGGRIVALEPRPGLGKRSPATKDDIYGGVRALLREDVTVDVGGDRMDPDDLALCELHGLRALATAFGWLTEEEIDITCRNCDEVMALRPCAHLRTAPFTDAELDDPELDAMLDLEQAHDVPGVGRVVLRPLRAEEALPLHRALAKDPLVITPAVVQAMGVVSIGDQRSPAKLARRIERLDDTAFGELGRLFVEAHYPPRLFALVLCPRCGARNDVDAPYDRELGWDAAPHASEHFPSFDELDAMAIRIAEPLLAETPGVRLVVEGGVPACDDGGEPLLGSYVPGEPLGEVTVYYRTFEAMWKEDGPYDVAAELRETIEHELEHHASSLTGHDPKDDEERDEIARQAARVIGRKELARRSTLELGRDLGEFVRRTWIIWIVVLIVVTAAALSAR